MDNIKIFENPDFGTVTTIIINGSPWFIGREVAEILGYERGTKAVIDHVDREDRHVFQKSYFGNLENVPNRGLTCINESGLYSLILSSKLPTAKRFKHWVTSEVLPAIRQHGAYLTPETIEQVLYNPDTIIKIATALKQEQQRNAELSATNDLLVEKINKYKVRDAINALIRLYASNICNDNFGKAWNIFYKKLNYDLHINIRNRKAKCKNQKSMLDLLNDEEIKGAARVATAMCEGAGIQTGRIIIEY